MKAPLLLVLVLTTPFLAPATTDEEVEALVQVESRNKNVVGDSGRAVGILQTWKIRVDECNRIVKEQRWSYDDRHDPIKSRSMCRVYLNWCKQHYPNESPSVRMGRWRNPKGNAPKWYLNKVSVAYVAYKKGSPKWPSSQSKKSPSPSPRRSTFSN